MGEAVGGIIILVLLILGAGRVLQGIKFLIKNHIRITVIPKQEKYEKYVEKKMQKKGHVKNDDN